MIMNQAELRSRFAAQGAPTSPESPWDRARASLHKEVRENPAETLLRWPTVVGTMFAGGDYVNWELEEIQDDPLWAHFEEAIKAPDFGGRDPDDFAPLGTNSNVVHQAFHAFLLQHVSVTMDFSKLETVVEWGGGYGAMCLLLHNLGFRGNYTIVDLPELLLLQEYYLSNTHPRIESVSFGDVFSEPVDLFMANFSLSETPIQHRAVPDAQYYYFSFQKEFDGVDNLTWFQELADSKPGWWVLAPFPSIPSCYYMIGVI